MVELLSRTNCGRPLSMLEFQGIMKEIEDNHRFGEEGKSIKYIKPVFDMRGNIVFTISFNHEITFDFRESTMPMIERINKWLNTS